MFFFNLEIKIMFSSCGLSYLMKIDDLKFKNKYIHVYIQALTHLHFRFCDIA